MKDKDNNPYACYSICDFCVNYKDNNSGSKKRDFSGVGICMITKAETTASDSCCSFECSICNISDHT